MKTNFLMYYIFFNYAFRFKVTMKLDDYVEGRLQIHTCLAYD